MRVCVWGGDEAAGGMVSMVGSAEKGCVRIAGGAAALAAPKCADERGRTETAGRRVERAKVSTGVCVCVCVRYCPRGPDGICPDDCHREPAERRELAPATRNHFIVKC